MLDIVLLGAGRLATNLGKALVGHGHRVKAVYSRTLASAQALADRLECPATDSIRELPQEADAFILSIKDDALAEVISRLAEGRRQQLMLHTAGSVDADIFAPYAERYGVLYPMQTFSKEREVNFSEIPLFIEGSDPAIRPLAESISRHVYPLASADRKQLHLAAVFASNFVNHCYALSADILERSGLPFSVMLPLIDETARKVHYLHPLDAQTGPAIRYDTDIISMQASLLEHQPTAKAIYELMSQSIHACAGQEKR
jgi:predicted short-subunit dehydrogenase-like oxidoreductase (DUF2520 family)